VKILLVAENDLLREVMARIFRRHLQIPTVGVTSVEEALDQVSDEVRLVVTDIILRGKGGIELIRAVRSRPSGETIPILAMSTDAANARPALAAGANAFLEKPFDNEHLVSTMKTLVGLA
jgi:CheY-like chemotaxis protein